MRRTGERGFALIETMAALAIAIVVMWLLFYALSQVLLVSRIQAARDGEQSTISQLTDNLATEEDDAWAIYVPPADVFEKANGDGHEVDYFTRDGKQQTYFWAYDYDPSTQTVTRYRFSAPGAAITKDVTYSGITAFAAATYPVTALQDSNTPIYSALYNGASLQSGIVHFYPSMPWIAGGNNITYVHFEGATMKRDVELATETAPSGFTIVMNYTPSPAPSASPGLSVWPPAVRFPVAGSTLASVNRVPAMAQRVNELFGGGVALAAGCMTAIAYGSAGDMSNDVPLANATDPYDSSVTTDGAGCLSASVVSLNEPGFTNSFSDQVAASNPCTTAEVAESGWTPSRSGPTASQSVAGGTTATLGCNLAFAGGSSAPVAQVAAQVIEPCWVVGGSCTWTPAINFETASCNRGVSENGGWAAGVMVSASASVGTITNNGNGTYTFTRSSTGSMTITARQEYIAGYSISTCSPSAISYKQVDSVTYQSV